eukprot:3400057-Rhodomonas_salina.1
MPSPHLLSLHSFCLVPECSAAGAAGAGRAGADAGRGSEGRTREEERGEHVQMMLLLASHRHQGSGWGGSQLAEERLLLTCGAAGCDEAVHRRLGNSDPRSSSSQPQALASNLFASRSIQFCENSNRDLWLTCPAPQCSKLRSRTTLPRLPRTPRNRSQKRCGSDFARSCLVVFSVVGGDASDVMRGMDRRWTRRRCA